MPRPVDAKYPITLGYRAKMKSDPSYIHRGIDYGVPVGTTVRATKAGKVKHAGTGGMGPAFGIHVVIQSGSIFHIYAHLSSEQVSAGQDIEVGQVLGKSGKTGNVTGPHLHYGEFTGYSYLKDRKPIYVDQPAASSKPPVADWSKPSSFVMGATGEAVTCLGQRLVIWAKHYGLPAPYKVGPGDPFSETDRKAVEAFQRKQGWTGKDADGYPGAETLKRLAADPKPSDPKPPTKTVTLTALHWNIAGSQDGKYGAANATRGDDVGRYAKKIGYEVFLTCEASQKNLRNGVSTILGKPWYTAAKSIWTADGVKLLASRKSYADSVWAYLKTTKYGAAMFGEKDGKKYSILEIHTDYRRPAKQAKQVQSIFRKFRADSDKLGIPHVNQFVVGDFNWDGTSGDNPFTALTAWNFIEHGSRTKATFTNSNGSKHLDGVLAHKDADVDVEVLSRADLSDHNPVRFKARLI